MYTQVVYCLERVPAVVKAKPEIARVELFKTVLCGDREAMAKFSIQDLEEGLDGHQHEERLEAHLRARAVGVRQ